MVCYSHHLKAIEQTVFLTVLASFCSFFFGGELPFLKEVLERFLSPSKKTHFFKCCKIFELLSYYLGSGSTNYVKNG